MPPDFVYLASGSPRRRELLDQIGVRFQVLAAAVDERPGEREAAGHYVARLAGEKARAGWPARTHDAPVLAADTAVTVDGRILGKPVDREDAERMLAALSDRTHEVWTAVALQTSHGLRERVSRSTVTFRRIDPAEMRAYWNTGEPRDKAGGYAIQGLAAVFVAALSGSYSGVMGLPLFETAELLREAGIAAWHQADAR